MEMSFLNVASSSLRKVFHELRYPAIACLPAEARRRQVVFLAVADEDIVFEPGEE